MKVKPGDRILVTRSAWAKSTFAICEAVEGSVARVLTLEEYEKAIPSIDPECITPMDWVKKCLEEEKQFPVMFETVGEVKEEQRVGEIICKVGSVTVLDTIFFKLLKDEDAA